MAQPTSLPGHPGHLRFPPLPKVEPLKVIVVGAGIGGLTAAIALRRSGHYVTIFEQSRFSAEIGAAIHVGCNASRALSYLGYSEKRLAGVECLGLTIYNSSGETESDVEHAAIIKRSKSPWYLCHRVDLHNELKHLALAEEGEGRPCILKLSSKVDHIDPEIGEITLGNGEKHKADLIVGADGIHSLVRETVFHPKKPEPTGEAAYRFILDATAVTKDPECLSFDVNDGRCRIIMAPNRRVVVYPCRNFELLNFVCIHPQESQEDGARDWNSQSSVERLVETYKDFSPKILNMLKKAQDVKCWQLLKRDPIDSWVKGRVCLIGDAAHPMLPHQGQGGGQSIEDGAGLGALFTLGTPAAQVPAVLKLFQQVRHLRASKIAWLSATQAAGLSSWNPQVVQQYVFNHDVMEYAKQTRSSELII